LRFLQGQVGVTAAYPKGSHRWRTGCDLYFRRKRRQGVRHGQAKDPISPKVAAAIYS
jgi:hypothetical protein